jgi:hypothetical protein
MNLEETQRQRQASRDEKCCVNLRKYLSGIFVGQWGEKRLLKRHQPSGELLSGEKRV